MDVRAPTEIVRNWLMDSRRWEHFTPRPDDIVIGTAPKCGTTWMQRIVSLLVFQTPDPIPLHDTSPWLECRFQKPFEIMLPDLEAQTHRRFIKTHLPLDALPFYETLRYIHVARDGRDACMSLHNHFNGFTEMALGRFDKIGLEDETIAAPFPRPQKEPRAFFRNWIDGEGLASHSDSFFDLERSYWAARDRENILFVHYNDLKADLDVEMRRIAAFLGIAVNEEIWPQLVDAARFETMKAQGKALLPAAVHAFAEGHDTFIYRGTNERWRELLTAEDLAAYEARTAEALPPGLKAWLAQGRKAGDPKAMKD